MIPIALEIKNFLSYGPIPQTITFGSYHLICLSGKNGHGKTALLDAMTWALWGQARKISGTSKPDAHLLRLGQKNMSVVFDFICNNQEFRIKREYSRINGKPHSVLEFGIIDTTKQLHALTEKTIRHTQEKIIQMIGLDFETFSNTAFLRQGHSQEFSQKSPQDRKAILANILKLNQYEQIRKAAGDKLKEYQLSKQHKQSVCLTLDQELEQKASLVAHSTNITASIQSLNQQEQKYTTSLRTIEQKKVACITSQQEISFLSVHQDSLNEKIAHAYTKLRTLYQNWRDINQKQKQTTNIDTYEQQKKQLVERINTHQKQLQTQLELQTQLLELKQQQQELQAQLTQTTTLTAKKQEYVISKLETERVQKSAILEQLTHDKSTIIIRQQELETRIGQLDTNLKTHQAQHSSEHIQTIHIQFEKRKEYYHTWTTEAQLIQQAYQQLQQKILLANDKNNPSCPLCEQNLSASRKRFLKQQFTKQELFYIHRIERLKKILPRLKQLLVTQHTQIQAVQEQQQVYTLKAQQQKDLTLQLQQIIEQQKTTQQSILTITRSITQLDAQLKQSHHEYDAFIRTIPQLIEQDERMQKIIQQLTLIDKQKNTLQYRQDQHKQDTDELEKTEAALAELQHLVNEIALQTERKKAIYSIIHTIKEHKKEYLTTTQKITQLQTIAQEFTLLEHEYQQQYAQLQEKIKEKQALLEQKGRIEQQKKQCELVGQKKEFVIKELNVLEHEIGDYQAISHALSKDGIQALLIEQALPEIEHEANTLLSLLTNNQSHIIIESLRDLQKGGVRETLDIKISDPMGIRPYEMYSGGEAFRIDFALRIAISKLLAHRAGTALQTLIIDEGFGSQDDEGLSRIMDCIYKIQDHFKKIIIVSHLPNLKEQFPLHFYIEKKPHGSHVQLIEQG